jgi:hypothetical protein
MPFGQVGHAVMSAPRRAGSVRNFYGFFTVEGVARNDTGVDFLILYAPRFSDGPERVQ